MTRFARRAYARLRWEIRRGRRRLTHVRHSWRLLVHKPEYFLSVVCIVKDEADYLEEFVSYYAVLGVDHFFIYDNGSKTPVGSTLSRYLDLCTVIDYPKSPRTVAGLPAVHRQA